MDTAAEVTQFRDAMAGARLATEYARDSEFRAALAAFEEAETRSRLGLMRALLFLTAPLTLALIAAAGCAAAGLL